MVRHVIESPIEAMLLAELYRRQEVREVVSGSPPADHTFVFPKLKITTQVNLKTDAGDFRVDILVEALGVCVAVECDGAEFHGSAEQKARDRDRDAALRRAGLIVARFTGREIFRDAPACADEIRRCLWFVAGRPHIHFDGAPGDRAGRRGLGSAGTGGSPWRSWRAGESEAPSGRLAVSGAAADAIGLLAAFPELAPIAEEENLPGLLPQGPLADLARDLLREPAGLEAALARLATAVDEAALNRIRALGGPGRPEAATAGGQLRKACIKAAIELVVAEQGRLHAEIARQGSPVPDELLMKAQNRARVRADLQHRLSGLEAPP